jgi:hypothetical protein
MAIKRFMNWIFLMSAISACAIILFFVALSYWTPVTFAVLPLGSLAHQIAANYDSVLPEITIRNSRLSIRARQPCLLYPLGGKDWPLVIDTRDVRLYDLMDSLKDVSQGIVLGSDLIVVKYHVRTYIVPFRGLPDAVLNTLNIEKFISVILHDVKLELKH